jgi:hypothetical protein
MQERVYQKRGEPYLLIKSPPASGIGDFRYDPDTARIMNLTDP